MSGGEQPSKYEKKERKKQWMKTLVAKHHDHNRRLAQDRFAAQLVKEHQIAEPDRYYMPTADEALEYSQRAIERKLLYVPKKNTTVRRAISKRVLRDSSAYRQQLAFLSCRRVLGLPRDVMRLICQYLQKRERVYFLDPTDGSAWLQELPAGPRVHLVGQPSCEHLNALQFCYDAQDEEVWLLCGTCHQAHVHSLRTDEVRSHQRPELCRNVKGAHWADGLLLLHQKRALFGYRPHPTTGRLQVDRSFPNPLEQHIRQLEPISWVSGAGLVLVLSQSSSCLYRPTRLSETGCPCCRLPTAAQRLHASRCCLAVQVLFLSDPQYGWCSLPVPPVHYARPPFPPPRLLYHPPRRQLYLLGGHLEPEHLLLSSGYYEPLRYDDLPSSHPVLPQKGAWRLDLALPDASWQRVGYVPPSLCDLPELPDPRLAVRC